MIRDGRERQQWEYDTEQAAKDAAARWLLMNPEEVSWEVSDGGTVLLAQYDGVLAEVRRWPVLRVDPRIVRPEDGPEERPKGRSW
jgi:hypothetical protein